MNAASVLKFLMKKSLSIFQKKNYKVTNLIGSDVILGMYSKNLILSLIKKLRNFQSKIHFCLNS